MKFSKKEISSFWYEQTGIVPKEPSLQLLAHRTEGWVAGIQLVILSQLNGGRDALQHFTGNHQFVRTFLMRTSIIERMNKDRRLS